MKLKTMMQSNKVASTILIVLWLQSVTSQSTSGADLMFACPPWFTPNLTNGTITCTCGREIGDYLRCDQDNQKTTLRLSKCMTFDNYTTFVGECPLAPVENASLGYLHLPENLSDLNEFMCGRYNREGQLCGKCKDGYSPAILSYGQGCMDCRDKAATSLLTFFAITIIPVTLFYFIILFFVRVNVLSPYLNAFVLYAQLLAAPGNLFFARILTSQIADVDNKVFTSFFEVVSSIYGIWNLDFLLPFIQDCLTDSLTHVTAYYLKFVVALYAVLLVIVTIILIELHDRNFKPVVWVVLPFRKCFRKLFRNWDPRKSVIKTFATFILLSYVKIGSVSAGAFHTTVLHDISRSSNDSLYFYFDGSVRYLSDAHRPLAIIAGICLVTITMPLPVLLIFYQFKFFQSILSCCCSIRIREGLRTFMEAFQGYYHDGSDNGYDCRFFASVYILLRMVKFVLTFHDFAISASTVAMSMLYILVGVTYIMVRPYKQNIFNIIDGFLLIDLGFLHILASLIFLHIYAGSGISFLNVLYPVLMLLPLMYIAVLSVYWVLCNTCLKKTFQRSKIISRLRNNTQIEKMNLRRNIYDLYVSSSLPDRIINPNAYQAIGV